jgi:hypothetical protein
MSDVRCAMTSLRGAESRHGVVYNILGGVCGARRRRVWWTTLVGCRAACVSGGLHSGERRCAATSLSFHRCVLINT